MLVLGMDVSGHHAGQQAGVRTASLHPAAQIQGCCTQPARGLPAGYSAGLQPVLRTPQPQHAGQPAGIAAHKGPLAAAPPAGVANLEMYSMEPHLQGLLRTRARCRVSRASTLPPRPQACRATTRGGSRGVGLLHSAWATLGEAARQCSMRRAEPPSSVAAGGAVPAQQLSFFEFFFFWAGLDKLVTFGSSGMGLGGGLGWVHAVIRAQMRGA